MGRASGCAPASPLVLGKDLMHPARAVVAHHQQQPAARQAQQRRLLELAAGLGGREHRRRPAAAAILGAHHEDLAVIGDIAEGQQNRAIGQHHGAAHAIAAAEGRSGDAMGLRPALAAVLGEMRHRLAAAPRPGRDSLGRIEECAVDIELRREGQASQQIGRHAKIVAIGSPARRGQRIPEEAPLVQHHPLSAQRRQPGAFDAGPVIARHHLRRRPALAPVGWSASSNCGIRDPAADAGSGAGGWSC